MTKIFLSCALAAFALGTAPQVLRAAEPEALCPRLNATLVGTYMSHGTGTVVGVGPVAAVGTITYDGHGNLDNPFTLSVNGSVSTFNQTGTYTVKSDCTGTVVQAGAHYNFVVSPDGNNVFWIETDGGTTITGTATRMKPTDTEQSNKLNRDTSHLPFGGAVRPESLEAVCSTPQKRGASGVLVYGRPKTVDGAALKRHSHCRNRFKVPAVRAVGGRSAGAERDEREGPSRQTTQRWLHVIDRMILM